MTVFRGWDDYVERLEKNWRALVAPEDTVVIAGDISWAMSLEETLEDFRFLQSLQEECGFDVCEISRQQIDDEKVSSTVVRTLIAEGDMVHAMRLLGRPYILIANIKEYAADPYKLLPPNGRYRVQIEGQGSAVLMISHNGINLDFASTYNLEKPLQIGFLDRIG
jgi:FAD synthase